MMTAHEAARWYGSLGNGHKAILGRAHEARCRRLVEIKKRIRGTPDHDRREVFKRQLRRGEY